MDTAVGIREREIGAFLRQCRLRAMAGNEVPDRRRHVPYLTQAEVAELAGVSESLVAQIETGRYAHLTPRLLAKLGAALRLDAGQTTYLRHLLAWPDAGPEIGAPGPLAAARSLVESIPWHPALLCGPRLEILAWNRCATATLTDFARLPQEERNAVRLMFSDRGFCRNWLTWEHRARTTVAGLRLRRSELPPGDEALEALIAHLRHNASFVALWEDGDLNIHADGDQDFLHPNAGLLRFHITVTEVLDLSYTTVAHLLPRDAETDAKLRRLAMREAGISA